jgi:aminopeptidase-like protein
LKEALAMRREIAFSDGCAPVFEEHGKAMMVLVEELFPICRSITGPGVRQTLRILQRLIPLEVQEVPSGTPVLDWTVPPEWNIRDAFIARDDGTRVVDFADNNLHVVQYSRPIHATMPLAQLRPISIPCPINQSGFRIVLPTIPRTGVSVSLTGSSRV